MSEKTVLKPLPSGFVNLIAGGGFQEKEKIPANMDFPLLDELEMDVPLLGDYSCAVREFPEDESEIDMQCLLHINPSLAMSSLSL